MNTYKLKDATESTLKKTKVNVEYLWTYKNQGERRLPDLHSEEHCHEETDTEEELQVDQAQLVEPLLNQTQRLPQQPEMLKASDIDCIKKAAGPCQKRT